MDHTGLFEILRQQNAPVLSKIKIISGDVSQLGLGLTPFDRQTLIDNIQIVVHAAASVRFDDTLRDAIILNTRGTREVCKLALEMKQILIFAYISTAYCIPNQAVIEEKLYPPIADWEKSIKIAEEGDQQTINILTQKYMGTMPNTYTFSKNLAEHVVNDMCKGKVPVMIGRPSIVISTHKDPFPGWIDNFNGPCGILVASGKGLIRIMHAKPETVADHVPVDIIVKGLIMGIWKHLIIIKPEGRLDVSIFNGSSNNFIPVSIQQTIDIGRKLNWEFPLDDVVWYPEGQVTSCWYNYYFKFLFYQLLPCFILDCFIQLAGHKPLLVKIQRKIYTATHALSYFILNQWVFINDNGWALEAELLESDKASFSYDKYDLEPVKYFRAAAMGGKKYLLKENMDNLDKARAHLKRMWIIYKIYCILWYGAIFYVLFFKLDILSILSRKYGDVYLYLTTE